jgi:hypothetical protein
MIRRTYGWAILWLCLTAFCGALYAQNETTITVRMMDGKTGHLISTTNFLVWIDHQKTVHADWVQRNPDGTGGLTIPRDAKLLSIHGTYDKAMETYLNCDSVGDKPTPVERWYEVSQILSSGVVAPNSCSKLKEIAKPGEFVFFVRKVNWREKLKGVEP